MAFLSKLAFATFWGATTALPRPAGVSSLVFVPKNLETHRPDAQVNRICMAFMSGYKPTFHSCKKGVEDRRKFEDGDWMFWFSPFGGNKYKKGHIKYIEHIMSDECTPLKNLARPDSWGLVKHDKHSGFVFVHDNLNFLSKHFFEVNTFIRALWEYPDRVDKWLELVEKGVDKNEALYFMWVTQGGSGPYSYSFYTSNHGPLTEAIDFDNFLSGTPANPGTKVLGVNGWETGIHAMWGNKDRLSNILGLEKDGRFGYASPKDLSTLILERKK